MQQRTAKAVSVRKDTFEGPSRRMKSPKTVNVQKIMSPQSKAMTKMNSLKSLEYTFGIN